MLGRRYSSIGDFIKLAEDVDITLCRRKIGSREEFFLQASYQTGDKKYLYVDSVPHIKNQVIDDEYLHEWNALSEQCGLGVFGCDGETNPRIAKRIIAKTLRILSQLKTYYIGVTVQGNSIDEHIQLFKDSDELQAIAADRRFLVLEGSIPDRMDLYHHHMNSLK